MQYQYQYLQILSLHDIDAVLTEYGKAGYRVVWMGKDPIREHYDVVIMREKD